MVLAERGHLDLGVAAGVGVELGLELRHGFRPALGTGEAAGGDILAAVAQVGREDLGVPAARRRDLDHRHRRFQPEEGQRLDRVAVRVARPVGLRALRTLQNRTEIGLGELRRGERRDGGKGDRDDDRVQAHGAVSGWGTASLAANAVRMKANSSAVSRSASKRPDLPPWPAPMLVLSNSGLASVFR